MKTLSNRLTFRVGSIIILVEIVIMLLIDGIYLAEYTDSLEEQTGDYIQHTYEMINAGVLSPEILSDCTLLENNLEEVVRESYLIRRNSDSPPDNDGGEVIISCQPDRIGSPGNPDWRDVTALRIWKTDSGMAGIFPVNTPYSPYSYLGYIETGNTRKIEQRNAMILPLLFSSLAVVLATSMIILITFHYLIIGRIQHIFRLMSKIEVGDWKNHTLPTRPDDEIGVLRQVVISMGNQLQDVINTLELRVAARTLDLQIAAEVSRQVATVLDIDELLQQVVDLTNRSFDFYYTFVFLLDEDNQLLIRAAGGDPLGQAMKRSSESIPLDEKPGVVPLAARTREVVVVNNTLHSPIHKYRPQLPHTRSEMAVPMVLGGKLMGVFDVQSRLPGRFGEDDIRVITTLAEQVAVAVQNARLFEEQRRVAEELRRIDTMKSQFLAHISHELRTPLNAVLNLSGFVHKGVFGSINDRQRDALHKVIVSGKHLLGLINDLLDFSKIGAGKMQLFKTPVNLNNSMQDIIATVGGLDRHEGVALHLEIQPDLPVIQADRRRIEQILLNLISNAIKFTGQGHITVRAWQEDKQVMFAISDTGFGIEPTLQEQIFEPFEQAYHGNQQGTGLGLPISRYLTEAHGGRLWLESEVGQGTTFFVELPIIAPDSPEVPTPAQNKNAATIL